MKKQAKDLKVGDKIKLADKICIIMAIEASDIGKQGKRKIRLELITESKEKIIIIRPEDYPFDLE